ncbi:hypothetical protein [Tissierella pigra]|uniref:Uncharacterized protein n=1 Tax=Tissierella pigra TaxID=2607614 RepID=A0A6N7Y1C1_9FIRM|nr:hypothetical protein [Tissierella pigra]MSU01800.1 hypothetical protein [Tissierella pigra]
MKNIIDDTSINSVCPSCKNSIKIKVKDIGKNMTCPKCSKNVLPEVDNDFVKESERAKKSFDELDKTLKDFKERKDDLF